MSFLGKESTAKILPAMLERMGRLACLRGLPDNIISAPNLAEILLYLFRVGLALSTVGISHSAISAF